MSPKKILFAELTGLSLLFISLPFLNVFLLIVIGMFAGRRYAVSFFALTMFQGILMYGSGIVLEVEGMTLYLTRQAYGKASLNPVFRISTPEQAAQVHSAMMDPHFAFLPILAFSSLIGLGILSVFWYHKLKIRLKPYASRFKS